MLVINFLCLEFAFQSTKTVPQLCYFTKNVEPSDTDYDVSPVQLKNVFHKN